MSGWDERDQPLVDAAFQQSPACAWTEEFRGIFWEFIDDGRQRLARIEALASDIEGSPQEAALRELGQLAHKLRGSALSFGWTRFAAQIKNFETQARVGNVPGAVDLQQAIQTFEDSLHATITAHPVLKKLS
jgi:HPt (histidine-containing phosphotransfer) domain-containing protein